VPQKSLKCSSAISPRFTALLMVLDRLAQMQTGTLKFSQFLMCQLRKLHLL